MFFGPCIEHRALSFDVLSFHALFDALFDAVEGTPRREVLATEDDIDACQQQLELGGADPARAFFEK